ncbi:GTPase [Flavobacteriaceae bacterium 14752]|uniref:GTPase n=1 Tax=Mesohalobacter salilacus TaxID=2491711 RepID=UPI000F63E25D|nr:GTPase [Flavobacteriaceae bacterium 14752]
MEDNKPKLIFVYNADSGLKNALMDSAHKILSPKTYKCKLCELTYGAFKEKKAWKKFRQESDVEMKFLHADEFLHLYKSKFRPNFELPVVLLENQYDLEVLISSNKFKAINSLETLIKQLNSLLKTI